MPVFAQRLGRFGPGHSSQCKLRSEINHDARLAHGLAAGNRAGALPFPAPWSTRVTALLRSRCVFGVGFRAVLLLAPAAMGHPTCRSAASLPAAERTGAAPTLEGVSSDAGLRGLATSGKDSTSATLVEAHHCRMQGCSGRSLGVECGTT